MLQPDTLVSSRDLIRQYHHITSHHQHNFFWPVHAVPFREILCSFLQQTFHQPIQVHVYRCSPCREMPCPVIAYIASIDLDLPVAFALCLYWERERTWDIPTETSTKPKWDNQQDYIMQSIWAARKVAFTKHVPKARCNAGQNNQLPCKASHRSTDCCLRNKIRIHMLVCSQYHRRRFDTCLQDMW